MLSGFTVSLKGQTLNQVRAWMKSDNYVQAEPAILKLLKGRPNDGSLNQWYGVCLYKKGEYLKSIPYFQSAAKRKVLESNRYLGMIYFNNYQFSLAVDHFNIFLTEGNTETKKVNQLVRQSELGARMMKGIEMVQIIDSMIVDKENFFKHYKLSSESGSLSTESNLSKGITHTNQRKDRMILDGEKENHFNLYMQDKLSNGWTEKKMLPENINTPYNERFPFLMPDGVTLYFASDGERSLGGYDLFVTRYNLNSEQFLTPENIGMPFNSIYNDYLLAIDELNNIGWFASDRNQSPDSLVVYLFIPNAEKVVYHGNDEKLAIGLAKINSIQETWNSKNDYTKLLNNIYSQESEIPSTIQKAFIFVVNDKYVYHQPNEFKSIDALFFFEKAQGAKEDIRNIKNQLELLRLDYGQQSASRKNLAPRILEMEQKLSKMYPLAEQYENLARKEELRLIESTPK